MAPEIITKTFQYKIRATKKFIAAAEKALEDSRFVYNCALEQRILRYQQGKPIGYLEQCRDLTEARTLDDIGSCHRKFQQEALQRLDRAFQRFFRRVKDGGNPGYPRFKPKLRYSTFGHEIDQRLSSPLNDDRLTIPGIGKIRIRLSRPVEGSIREFRIMRCADGWHALLVCSLEKPGTLPLTNKSVGIDLGLNHFAALSNGELIDKPKHLRAAARALRRSQQAFSRKNKLSQNRVKARIRLSRKHLDVANSRKDFHHKTAFDIVKRFDSISVEDLKINGLLKNHRLADSISDSGWGHFLSILSYKAENAGRLFVKVNPKYTSQACSSCGNRQQMPLATRIYQCLSCGLILDRDVNAAINIRLGKPKFTPAESHERRGSRNRRPLPDVKEPQVSQIFTP